MRIEPISYQTYQPYVYKPNTIDSNSLSKVKRIGDDLLASKNDFSGLTEKPESQETTNPLRRGETIDFNNILDRQMQMGRMNASRIIKPAEQGASEVKSSDEKKAQEKTSQEEKQSEQLKQSNISNYQMQRAAEAYQMFMTA